MSRLMTDMTEQEAKDVILHDPDGNISRRLEAIRFALRILGEGATMREIYGWAEGRTESETIDTGPVH